MDGFRAPEVVHSVQNMDDNRDFGSSGLLGMRTKGVADDTALLRGYSLAFGQEEAVEG